MLVLRNEGKLFRANGSLLFATLGVCRGARISLVLFGENGCTIARQTEEHQHSKNQAEFSRQQFWELLFNCEMG